MTTMTPTPTLAIIATILVLEGLSPDAHHATLKKAARANGLEITDKATLDDLRRLMIEEIKQQNDSTPEAQDDTPEAQDDVPEAQDDIPEAQDDTDTNDPEIDLVVVLEKHRTADPDKWTKVVEVLEANAKGKPIRVMIKCQDPRTMADGSSGCYGTREIATQDLFQVDRCEWCQKRFVRQTRAAKLKAKRKAKTTAKGKK